MSEPRFYANRVARYYLIAIQSLMGDSGLRALINLSGALAYHDQLPPDDLVRGFSFEQMSAINMAALTMFGAKGGQRLARNTGHKWLWQGLMQFGALAGMSDPAFRALSQPEQIHLALLALADMFTRFSDQTCMVTDADASYHFTVMQGGFTVGLGKTKGPVCWPMVGLIEETVQWATGGIQFDVIETACAATGAPTCIFEISKQPTA